jgi:hypothetical protein
MHFAKEMMTLAAGIGLLAFTQLAEAHPLTINNHTTSPISFSVNNRCAKEFGTVHEFEVVTISAGTLKEVCASSSVCEISGYKAERCRGQEIGGIRYLGRAKNNFIVFGGATNSNVSVGATASNLIYESANKHK